MAVLVRIDGVLLTKELCATAIPVCGLVNGLCFMLAVQMWAGVMKWWDERVLGHACAWVPVLQCINPLGPSFPLEFPSGPPNYHRTFGVISRLIKTYVS